MKDIKYWSSVIGPNSSPSGWNPGSLQLLDNGYYAIRKPNGMYLSIDTFGNLKEAPEPRGTWEYFTLSSSLNVITVTPDLVTYAIYVTQ